MSKWQFVSEGDGRVLTLMQGERAVLAIDKTRLKLTDETGIERGLNRVIGRGFWPSWEDQKHIEQLLNSQVCQVKTLEELADYIGTLTDQDRWNLRTLSKFPLEKLINLQKSAKTAKVEKFINAAITLQLVEVIAEVIESSRPR